MDLKLGGAQRNCKRQKIELDFISSSPTDSFCAGLDHFPPRGEGADILWGLRSSKDRQKERSLCPFAFGGRQKYATRILDCASTSRMSGGDARMEKKDQGKLFFVFFCFFSF